MHIHTTFCIFVNGPKKSGYDSTYYILHFSISRFGLHTTFYICDFECLLKLHTTFYIFDFRPGTYIRHLHLPVGEVNRAASTFYIWRVNNMRANSYTYYIPDPAYIRPALVTIAVAAAAMANIASTRQHFCYSNILCSDAHPGIPYFAKTQWGPLTLYME